MKDYEIEKFLKDNEEERYKFERVRQCLSANRHTHLISKIINLWPDKHSPFAGADHDIIYLDVKDKDIEKLREEQQKDFLIEALRCGARWDSDSECLAFYV